MAGSKKFRCRLITPEASVLDGEVSGVVVTAHDGEVGILRDHAPLVCALGIGELRVTREDQVERYYVDGGFARVLNNEVLVLTQQAQAAADIDGSAARRDLSRLQEQHVSGVQESDLRTLEIKRLRTKIKLTEPRM